MWERITLKNKAKLFLKGHYLPAFVVSLVLGIATGNSSVSNSFSNRQNEFMQEGHTFREGFSGYFDYIPRGVMIFAIIAVIVGLLIKIFLLNPIEVGGKRFYVKAAEREEAEISHLIDAFKDGTYKNIAVSLFFRDLYIFLWSLLFIIPGVVKSYAYRMTPYILADNPNMEYSRALELSNQMTMGQKWNIFVLDLSFIGWRILGTLAFGLGNLFVNPYVDATNGELYLVLRANSFGTYGNRSNENHYGGQTERESAETIRYEDINESHDYEKFESERYDDDDRYGEKK